MNLLRESITFINVICVIWNIINIFVEPVNVKTLGLLWIYNVSSLILILERYLPEIKNKKIVVILTSIISTGYILSLLLMISDIYDVNLILCIIFNFISYIFSIVYFIKSKNI